MVHEAEPGAGERNTAGAEAEGEIPRVAERYGVSIGAIAAIQARNSWQWVPEPEES